MKIRRNFVENTSELLDQDERIAVLRKIIMESLPQYNRAVLYEVIRLLHLISTHSGIFFSHLPCSLSSAINRMNASNLAIAFGPTLLKSQDEVMKFDKNTQVQSVIQEIIESYHEIFKVYMAEELANSRVPFPSIYVPIHPGSCRVEFPNICTHKIHYEFSFN